MVVRVWVAVVRESKVKEWRYHYQSGWFHCMTDDHLRPDGHGHECGEHQTPIQVGG